MKLVFIAAFLLGAVIAPAQDKYNKVKTGKLKAELFSKDKEFKKWYAEEYKAYRPVDSLIAKLIPFLADKKIVVVLGTWCSDSQLHFPHLMKVLAAAKFPIEKLTVYGIDKNKTIPADVISRYKIASVPTIMVYTNETELGRLVEAPKISIEYDLTQL